MRNPIRELRHVVATNYVGVASYTFLIYDHLLTLSDEVNYIWRGRKRPVIYLFFLNRYFFPFAFIVNLYAYLTPSFDPKMCKHFVRYEGASVVLGFGLTGLMMILRVNALYGGNCRPIQAILGTLWIAQISVYSWLLSTGNPVPHSSGIHGCSLVYDPSKRRLASLSAAVSIVFDTLVLCLTLYKTGGTLRRSRRASEASNILLKTLMKDGIIYYCVVISANISLTIMLATASPGISNILSQFAQLLTVTMISRITLHLRKTGAKRSSLVIMSNPHPIPSAIHQADTRGGVMAGSVSDNSEETLVSPTFTAAGCRRVELTSGITRDGCLNVTIGSIVIAGGPRDDQQPADELRRVR